MPDVYSKEWIQSFGNVVSVPSEVWAQNYGGPKYPKLFLENYNASGAGINVTWVSPAPTPITGIVQVSVRDRTDGCYVQSSPQSAVGDWTPVLTFGGSSTGITYTTRTGRYAKVGNLVFAKMAIKLSSKGAQTGLALIDGLPFVAEAGTGFYTVMSGASAANMSFTGQLVSYLAPGGTSLALRSQADGSQALLYDTAFTNTTDLMLAITYIAAS